MKKLLGTLLLFMLMLTGASVLQVDAASNPKLPSVTYYQKESVKYYTVKHLKPGKNNYWMENSIFWIDKDNSDAKVVSCTSSNKKVAVVKVNSDEWCCEGNFWVKKPGKATIKTVFELDGKRYTYKTKIKVKKWSNPLKSLKIGKTSLQKEFNSDNKAYCGNVKKGKLSVVPAKDWKVSKITFRFGNQEKASRIKNGSIVDFRKKNDGTQAEMIIKMKNKKTKDTVEIIMLNANFQK